MVAELDVQPFGISVCEDSDRLVVTCSTPLRQAVPFVSKSSRLMIYVAATGMLERVVELDNSYEIPRHALAIGHCFAVCHGWHRHGKVAVMRRGNSSPSTLRAEGRGGYRQKSCQFLTLHRHIHTYI